MSSRINCKLKDIFFNSAPSTFALIAWARLFQCDFEVYTLIGYLMISVSTFTLKLR